MPALLPTGTARTAGAQWPSDTAVVSFSRVAGRRPSWAGVLRAQPLPPSQPRLPGPVRRP